jgi:hypothetical protein
MLEYQKSSPALSPSPKSAYDFASLVWLHAHVVATDEIARLEIYRRAMTG